MAKVNIKLSESLREYIILTGWVKSKPEDVSLETNLGDSIALQYPYMTARMQCVVGPEMAVAAGRNGILTCIPRSLRDSDKQKILDANNSAKLKKDDIEYVENPEHKRPDETLEDAIRLAEKTGYSVVPVIDRFSRLYGFYIHNPDNLPTVPGYTLLKDIITPLKGRKNNKGIPFLYANEENKIKEKLTAEKRRFVPIVDKNMVLQKLAFLQKFDTNFIGIAITTRDKWEEELEKWGPQVDTMMIDSSNACFDNALKILKEAKRMFPKKPFGIGNIIKKEDFFRFADEGADYIIGGMGIGSICQTGSERGNGRGQFTVAKELAEARDYYHESNGKYVQLVIDGGISTTKDMTVALAFADLIMMGNYFNRFYEAAARKFEDKEGKIIASEEGSINYVETWGGGHPIARLVGTYGMNFREELKEERRKNIPNVLERYGHSKISTATIEGVVGTVMYKGRLKPCVERDARYIRTTIANSGASSLKEFREKAILEKASQETLKDMYPHDINIIP